MKTRQMKLKWNEKCTLASKKTTHNSHRHQTHSYSNATNKNTKTMYVKSIVKRMQAIHLMKNSNIPIYFFFSLILSMVFRSVRLVACSRTRAFNSTQHKYLNCMFVVDSIMFWFNYISRHVSRSWLPTYQQKYL